MRLKPWIVSAVAVFACAPHDDVSGPGFPSVCTSKPTLRITNEAVLKSANTVGTNEAPVWSAGDFPCVPWTFVNADSVPHSVQAVPTQRQPGAPCSELATGVIPPGASATVTTPLDRYCRICIDVPTAGSHTWCINVEFWCPQYDSNKREFVDGGCYCAATTLWCT